ncbi:hypothetical protein [Stutzerimonas balearica]|uniref:hypothetical protein n=1 Tax=Stutzerimonas balearica TaxID=74829 RepID=UPI00241DD435|nr:hypothetical protein [Stutzerimonas balearica]
MADLGPTKVYGDLHVTGGITGTVTGNADTATKLQTARTIGGVAFDGTANINLPGVNAAGNQSTTGNAATATKLATARTINGVAFDGSANITVADATKLPLSGGKMTGALVHQFLAGAAGVTTYRNLAVYTSNNGTVTGTIKITLPFGWTNTMMSLKLKGINYDAKGAWELSLGGYNYGGSPGWYNTSASTMGTSVPFSSVRFAFDGTNTCILLGNTASTWSYPKVIIEEMLAGYSNVELDWGKGWSITVIQDETGLSAFNEPVLNANTNALLLNGRDSAYYLDAGNLASGTIPDARLSGTYTGVNITGNAATATALQTTRTINGVSFNGTANITVADATKLPLTGGTLTGTLEGTRGIFTGTGNDYHVGGLEARGNGTANTVFPTIGFHQPGLWASSLQLRGASDFRFYGQGGTAYANVTAATFNGNLAGNATSATTAGSLTGTTTAAVPTAALGSGTASSSTFLAGDRTWKTVNTSPPTARGGVGTYAFAYAVNEPNASNQIAGSSLQFACIQSTGGVEKVSSFLTGTWQAMGHFTTTGNGYATLWLRIS